MKECQVCHGPIQVMIFGNTAFCSNTCEKICNGDTEPQGDWEHKARRPKGQPKLKSTKKTSVQEISEGTYRVNGVHGRSALTGKTVAVGIENE